MFSFPAALRSGESKKNLQDAQACNDAFNARETTGLDTAMAKLTSVIQVNPQSWACFEARAGLYVLKGDRDKAITDETRAIELSKGKEAGPIQTRALLFWRNGSYEQALSDCKLALSRNRKDGMSHWVCGDALVRMGRYAEAFTDLDEALKPEMKVPEMDRSRVLGDRAIALFHLQKYDEAIGAFDLYFASDPAATYVPWARFARGLSEWKLGRLDKAKSDAEIFLEEEPRLQINFSGDHALEMFDLEKRRAATTQAIDIAQSAEAKGDWSASFEAWAKAYSYVSSLMTDGQAILGKISDGLAKDYSKLATKPALPELARRYRTQAETYFRDKDLLKAIKAYSKVLDVAPWDPQAHFNRGFLEGEQQQYQAAIYDMGVYLKLMPNAEDARAAQDQIYQWQAKLK